MSQIYGERWKVLKQLGEGGQAHTFLVTDVKGEGDTLYVLKRLKNLKRLERFKREVEVVRNLSHPNVVRLIDFDLEADKPYLVTEYCVGGSLADAQPFWREKALGLLPGRVCQPVEALQLFHEICEGVIYAHRQGIIHRDIKPDNIFLRGMEGPPVIGDFGICYVEDGERFTLTEENVGPRGFIAPELEDGRAGAVTTKSDVYSLGKLLYWLLTGKTVPREGFRERDRDLKGYEVDSVLGWNNIYMEHINRLLDFMIVHGPQERRDLDNLLILLRRAMRKIERELNPVSPTIRQLCTYCGEGFYILRAGNNPTEVTNFGFRQVSNSQWRIYTCGECGHVQVFRLEKARAREWWELDERH
jgi:serine/threonine protein kinase